MLFPPMRLGDEYFGDGAMRQLNPLSPAIHLGADRLLVIGVRARRGAGVAVNRTQIVDAVARARSSDTCSTRCLPTRFTGISSSSSR